ncbi:MAG TPA: hypothetical protein ENK57_03485 [Polyangiaceae bacterium]|nr:hypothetical protein [Polyangiaceae bacterium]
MSPYSWRFMDPFRVPVPAPLRSIAISRGDYLFGCALLVGGEVSCFGGRDAASETCAQRDTMEFHRSGLPRPADGIAVQGDEACAHLDDDRLVCRGRRRVEREQEARCAQRTVTYNGERLRDVVRFDVGVALDRKGRVYTFEGDDGTGAQPTGAVAHRVPISRALAVASAGVLTCALFEDHRVGCFASRWWEDRRDFGADARVASARGRLKVEMIYGLPSIADIRCVPHRRCLATGQDGYLYAFRELRRPLPGIHRRAGVRGAPG